MIRCALCGKLVGVDQASYIMQYLCCKSCKSLYQNASGRCERCNSEVDLPNFVLLYGKNGKARLYCRGCAEVVNRILTSVEAEHIGMYLTAEELDAEVRAWKAILELELEGADGL